MMLLVIVMLEMVEEMVAVNNSFKTFLAEQYNNYFLVNKHANDYNKTKKKKRKHKSMINKVISDYLLVRSTL